MSISTQNTILFKTQYQYDFLKLMKNDEVSNEQCIFRDSYYCVYTFDCNGDLEGIDDFPYMAYETLCLDNIEDGLFTQVKDSNYTYQSYNNISKIIENTLGEYAYNEIKDFITYPELEKYQQDQKQPINIKIADWLGYHANVLDDLAEYCHIDSDDLIGQLDDIKKEPNKVVIDERTPFSIIKMDNESNVALLQNELTQMYNVVHNINKEYDGWDYSLIYTKNLDEAKQIYTQATCINMNYTKYKTIDYLKEVFDDCLEYDVLNDIVNKAHSIVLKIDDTPNNRVTDEDLSEFITRMYIENGYAEGQIPFEYTDISKMNNDTLLEQFYQDNELTEDEGLEI